MRNGRSVTRRSSCEPNLKNKFTSLYLDYEDCEEFHFTSGHGGVDVNGLLSDLLQCRLPSLHWQCPLSTSCLSRGSGLPLNKVRGDLLTWLEDQPTETSPAQFSRHCAVDYAPGHDSSVT
jgi:hypothetical protein